jgi:septum formation inhibitor MinC
MPSSAVSQAPDIFVTETMAELSARQGRTPDAIAIYRRLLDGAAPGDERRTRWADRLAALESGAAPDSRPGVARANPSPEARRPSEGSEGEAPGPSSAAPPDVESRPAEPTYLLPLVVTQPVRSGQIVYAQHTDLIVLAPVNPGAQLLADGNIHVYGPLRGRAVAGVRGAVGAQIFCLRLEAELVGVDAAYLISEDLPPAVRGRAARVWLEDGRCRVAALPV